jgi:hypothetical protein
MTSTSYRLPRMSPVQAAATPPPIPQSFSFGVTSMQPNTQNTGAWLTFTYISFAASVIMMGLGVWALPADVWVKGYLTMGCVFMLGSTFTLAKTVRDEHESKRMTNRLEDAKAERLLMEVGRTA